jgi:DNA-binding Xre family transcriptional regulator
MRRKDNIREEYNEVRIVFYCQLFISILKTGKAKAVRFSTLEAICRVLQCQPGDILEYADKHDERWKKISR